MISNTRIRGKPYPMNQFIGYTEPNHFKMVQESTELNWFET